MKKTFVLDACALIAFLHEEEGAGKVENVLLSTKGNDCLIYINIPGRFDSAC